MAAGSLDRPVGVVGLGDMGGAMARAMCRAGQPVVAFDLRPEAIGPVVALGGSAAASLTDVAERCEIISIVVLDDGQVRTVVGELAAVARPGATLIVHSTVQPATVLEVAAQVAAQGIDLIDASVSGGSEKGDLGALTVMVGGPADVVERCWPIFEAIGETIFHVGPLGAGATAKVVNNLLTLGTYALQLEAMQIAAAHGLDEDSVTAVVTASQGDSRGIRTWGRMDRIRRGRLAGNDPERVYEQISKDLRTAATVADAQELVLPLTASVAALMPATLAERDRELDRRGPTAEIPRCTACRQELAAPFRESGLHPECAAIESEPL